MGTIGTMKARTIVLSLIVVFVNITFLVILIVRCRRGQDKLRADRVEAGRASQQGVNVDLGQPGMTVISNDVSAHRMPQDRYHVDPLTEKITLDYPIV